MREIKQAKSEFEKLAPSDVFSATLPVESLKALVNHVMTERVDRRGRNLVLAVFDVSRAHFYGVCGTRCLRGGTLRIASYWTRSQTQQDDVRDAGCEQCAWSEHLRSNRFEPGASSPALCRPELVNGFCHGDDFVTAGAEDQIESFGKLLQEKYDTGRIGMTGAAEHLDKELEVLHRSVRVINNELMDIEPDQKHVPQSLEDLRLIQRNIVKTPRVILSAIEAETIENSPILEGRASDNVSERNHAMRALGAGPCGHI